MVSTSSPFILLFNFQRTNTFLPVLWLSCLQSDWNSQEQPWCLRPHGPRLVSNLPCSVPIQEAAEFPPSLPPSPAGTSVYILLGTLLSGHKISRVVSLSPVTQLLLCSCSLANSFLPETVCLVMVWQLRLILDSPLTSTIGIQPLKLFLSLTPSSALFLVLFCSYNK